jgi:pimeloyl-ACP methyl ester carboxylesterase
MLERGLPATVLPLGGVLLLSCPSFLSGPTFAQGFTYPAGFRSERIATNGTTLHVRIGGKGPAVVLLHGYGETGDMWAPLAADLARDHTVVAPDLRGMGLSARAERGFEKKNQAADIAGVMDALKLPAAAVVAHDIGNMVAFSFAAQHAGRVTRPVLMDAPVPGVGPWEEILKNPLLWHFRFGGPDMERLVAGRERIYLDRFWNEFSADPKRFGEASRRHYARLYARPGGDAGGLLAVRGLRPGRRRQPRFPRGRRPLEDAAACGRRRALLRRHHGGGDACRPPTTCARLSSRAPGTGSWKSSRRRPSPRSAHSSPRRSSSRGAA